MDTQPAFGLRELLTHVVGDIAKALCQREGETQQQRYDRTQAVAHTVMAFTPRDAIEAMLAGHCVMFHEMIVDSVQSTMGGEEMAKRRTTRGNIVAMDKAFGNNLDRLERYQSRQARGRRTHARRGTAPRPRSPTGCSGTSRERRHRNPEADGPRDVPREPATAGAAPRKPRTPRGTVRPGGASRVGKPGGASVTEEPRWVGRRRESAGQPSGSRRRKRSPRASPTPKRWQLSTPAIPRGSPRRWGSSSRATPILPPPPIKWRISAGRRP